MKRRVLSKTTPFHAKKKEEREREQNGVILNDTVPLSSSPGRAAGEEINFCFSSLILHASFSLCMLLSKTRSPMPLHWWDPESRALLAAPIGHLVRRRSRAGSGYSPCTAIGRRQGRPRSLCPINTIQHQLARGRREQKKNTENKRKQSRKKEEEKRGTNRKKKWPKREERNRERKERLRGSLKPGGKFKNKKKTKPRRQGDDRW